MLHNRFVAMDAIIFKVTSHEYSDDDGATGCNLTFHPTSREKSAVVILLQHLGNWVWVRDFVRG